LTTIFRSDFESVGFLRSEIIPYLRGHGIDVTSALNDIRDNTANNVMQHSETAADSALPDWRELVTHWTALSETECADVMLGLNPAGDRGYRFYDNNEPFDTWRRTIENACESGALPAKKQGQNWRITPAALIAWCQQYSYDCSLRIPRDAGRAVQAEVERDQLKKEVERLQAELLEVANRSDESGREADQLRARVAALEAKAPQYLDSTHDHYSPRLAAAVRAWEAVSSGVINGTPKQALKKWLGQHASEFKNLSAEEIDSGAYVANWKTTGGRAKGTADEFD
jgi:ElaB/YqjD/DUF883 family membrane-anchored ribosome-binding protein